MEHGMLELSYWGRSSRLIWARKNGDESAADCAGYQHRTTHGIDYWLERGIQACWCLRYARCAEIYEDALPSIGKLSLSWVRSQSAGAIFRMMFVREIESHTSLNLIREWLEAFFLPEQKPHKDDFLSGCGPCWLYHNIARHVQHQKHVSTWLTPHSS